MTRFYSAAAAFLIAAAPAMAQELQADYAPMAGSTTTSTSVLALRDSLLNDSGDNSVQFRIGYGRHI